MYEEAGVGHLVQRSQGAQKDGDAAVAEQARQEEVLNSSEPQNGTDVTR